MTGLLPETRQHPRKKGKLAGFTLVELLVVMAVLIILIGAAMPALSSLLRSEQLDQAAAYIPGELDHARQYAVAHNTYTWVAFYQDTSATGNYTLYVATIASTDGTDPSNDFANTALTLPSTQLTVVDRFAAFPQLSLKQAGANTWSTLPAAAGNVSSLASVQFTLPVPAKGTTEIFTQAVQFNPAGEARVVADLSDLVELGLRPIKGGTTEDTVNMAVIRIAGMTGQTRLYRP
jgi:Tfp pilus assembly protein FimT